MVCTRTVAMEDARAGAARYETRIATVEDFHSSQTAWNELVFVMPQPSAFLTWEWMYTWWEQLGGGRRLLVLFVYRNGALKGILPLFRERSRAAVGLDTFWFCGANDLYSDHLDIIAAPTDARACLESIGEFLTSDYRDWDAIHFPMITAESEIYSWLAQRKRSDVGCYAKISPSTVAHYIPVDGSFERYFASLDKKQRYNLRSRRKKLYENRQVRYVADTMSTAESMKVLFDLHGRRAARKGMVSSFGRHDVLAFHAAFAERAAAKGWVYFRFLVGPQGPLAAAYNLVMAGRVYSYQKGIDPEWEPWGPGTVLLYELVNEAFAQGMTEYNFLQGAEAYKSAWTPHFRTLYTARLYNRTIGGRLAACLFRSVRFIRRLLHGRRDDLRHSRPV